MNLCCADLVLVAPVAVVAVVAVVASAAVAVVVVAAENQKKVIHWYYQVVLMIELKMIQSQEHLCHLYKLGHNIIQLHSSKAFGD